VPSRISRLTGLPDQRPCDIIEYVGHDAPSDILVIPEHFHGLELTDASLAQRLHLRNLVERESRPLRISAELALVKSRAYS
jgi:hypothetical protein